MDNIKDIIDELSEKQRELSEYGKYLEECTYNPYETVQRISREIGELIVKLEKLM